jgi:hypothetical protein
MAQKRVAVAAAIALVAVAGGTVAATAAAGPGGVPDANGVIHGCYTPAPTYKAFVLTDGTHKCPIGYQPITFNQTGPQGPQGVTGPQGPSDAYVARVDGPIPVTGSQDGSTVVATVALPPGRFVLTGKAELANLTNSDHVWYCTLNSGEQGDVDLAPNGLAGDIQTAVVQDVLTLDSPGSVTLSCSADNADVYNAAITAIQVGAIHG